MPIVIRAEKIGKLHRINHEAQSRQFRYESLGETLANVGKSTSPPFAKGGLGGVAGARLHGLC